MSAKTPPTDVEVAAVVAALAAIRASRLAGAAAPRRTTSQAADSPWARPQLRTWSPSG